MPHHRLLAPLVLGLAALGATAAQAAPLSLLGDRFHVEASWRTPAGQTGVGTPVSLTSETGYFWFFSPTNVEVVVKVLDACASPSGRFWVFAGGLTDVEVTLEVTDNATGEKKTYRNPLGAPFQPIQDTSAFATCGTPRCGQGSFEELAATPRADPWLEALARILDGGLTASTAVYQRVIADTAAIRQSNPAMAGLSFSPYVSPQSLILTFHALTFPSVVADSYRDWDCLNSWYGMYWAERYSGTQVILHFDKVLDTRRVAMDYLALPGVTAAEIETFDIFPGLPPPVYSFCGRARGIEYHYYARTQLSGFGYRYSYYTTLPGAAPVLVGTSPAAVEPSQPPIWLQDALACFTEQVTH